MTHDLLMPSPPGNELFRHVFLYFEVEVWLLSALAQARWFAPAEMAEAFDQGYEHYAP